MVHLTLWSPPPRCNCATCRHNEIQQGKQEGSNRQLSGVPTVTLSALLVFLSRSMSLLGAVMQAGLKLLSKPRAGEFGSPWPERASAARSAQRPKIRLGHPRQAATMTLALDGGTGHTRGAPMPGPRRRRWTYTGSPGVSPSRQPACAGTVMPSSTVTWVLDRSVAAYPCGSGCCVPTVVSWKVLCSHFFMPWSRITLFSSVSRRLSTKLLASSMVSPASNARQRMPKKAPRCRPLMQCTTTLSPCQTVFFTAGHTSVHCSLRS